MDNLAVVIKTDTREKTAENESVNADRNVGFSKITFFYNVICSVGGRIVGKEQEDIHFELAELIFQYKWNERDYCRGALFYGSK